MGRFQGSLRLRDEDGPGLSVVIDLEGETLSIRSGESVIGTWPLSDVGIRGEDDGFHLRVDGEEVVVTTDDETGFALAVGLRSASPRMRRRIAAHLDR